jgi:hypothetical protein
VVVRWCVRTDIETFEEIDGLREGMLPFEIIFDAEHTKDSPNYITECPANNSKFFFLSQGYQDATKLLCASTKDVYFVDLGTNTIITKIPIKRVIYRVKYP